jgi:glycosyltransferase involved in cell wall biosynthesis
MACGTPVVGFDATALPDVVEHQATGYLARSFDVDDLANGIRWVLDDQDRWRSLSRRARNKVEREFTSERQARAYLALYEQILSEPPSARPMTTS